MNPIRSNGSSTTRFSPLPFQLRARPQCMQAQMSRPPSPCAPRRDQVSSANSSHFSQSWTRSAILKPRSFIFFFTIAACSSQGGSGNFFPMPASYHLDGRGPVAGHVAHVDVEHPLRLVLVVRVAAGDPLPERPPAARPGGRGRLQLPEPHVVALARPRRGLVAHRFLGGREGGTPEQR